MERSSNKVYDTIVRNLKCEGGTLAVAEEAIRGLEPSSFLVRSYIVDRLDEEDREFFMETPLHFMAAEACTTTTGGACALLERMIELSCPENLLVTDNFEANCLQSILLLPYESVSTSLMLATIRVLIKHMPERAYYDMFLGENVLHTAAQHRDFEEVALLVDLLPSALLYQEDENYALTPKGLAVQANSPAAIIELLS